MDTPTQEPGQPIAAPEPEPVPAAAEPELSAAAARIEQVVEGWYRERLCNSIVSRDTPVINHIRAAVDDLKRRLTEV